jgi:hypothetical protein
MPGDTFRRAPLRLLASATIVAVGLCTTPAFAQEPAQPVVNERQVQAFFNGIALDQQLAEQYSSPTPQTPANGQAAAAAPPRAASVEAASLPQSLDEPLDPALDDAAIVGDDDRTTNIDAPPSVVQTVLLVLASLALLAFAASVLTLVVRELKKDAYQRKHANRRRVKRHDTSTPAHAS